MAGDIEIGGKEKMLLDWVEVRNAILRADSGEMKVTHQKNDANTTGINGLIVELSLQFDNAVDSNFTDEEKAFIDAAQQQSAEEIK